MRKSDYEEGDKREFQKDKKAGLYQPDVHPESIEESNRKSGLAYGAVISLIGSILVFLGLGWAFDRYFATAPWLLVVGIILGSIIGFYQFVRISSQFD